MAKKRYEVKGVCPNCACGTPAHLTLEEIKAKVIDGENLEVNCPECMEVYRANAEDCKLEF
jgi:redox-regulated HSP33 family molecular chaperone